MAREIGVESDGDLFKMQQEAIRRARETAMQSRYFQTEEKHSEKCENIEKSRKKSLLFGNDNPISNLLKNFKSDDLILLVLLFLLINEEADDDIVLIILFLLFTGLK